VVGLTAEPSVREAGPERPPERDAIVPSAVPAAHAGRVGRGIDTRRWGLAAVAVGVAAQAVGLGIDAWQHAHDETLAAREGVFTLTNVGHALFFAGLVLTAVGVLMAVVGHRLYGPPARRVARHQRLLQFGVPIAVAAAVTAGAVGASRSSLSGGHAHSHDDTVVAGAGAPAAPVPVTDHTHAAGTPAHVDPPAAAAAPVAAAAAAAPVAASVAAPDAAAPPATAHSHANADQAAEAQADQPLDAATRATLAAQLTMARDAALRYPTAGDAAGAGFVLAGGFAPGSGAHYVHFASAGGASFDPADPDTLVYAGTDPSSPLVGAMYTSLGGDAPPEGFAGPNDHWHRHFNVCVRFGGGKIEVPFPADRDVTSEQCSAVSGTFMPTTVWMVHAWVVPAWESPLGVFSHDNPNVRCADGTTNTDAAGFCTGLSS
jgi:hypothetical protein